MNVTYKPISTLDVSPVGLGAWSFSKVKTLSKCPFQFYLKYALKAKPVEPIPVSVQTESGKAVHRVLELVMQGKSIEDSFRITKQEFEEVLPGDLWENGHDPDGAGGVARNEYSVVKFKERMDEFEKKYPVKRYMTELKIGVTKDWKPTGFFTTSEEKPEKNVFYRGVIDLVVHLGNDDVIFIDHKRGVPSITGVRNFQDQLDTYKVLFSKGIQRYGNGSSAVHFVNDGEMTMGTTTEKSDIENNLANRVEFAINGAIDKTTELGFFKHIRGSHCQWCDFNTMCKAGELKPLELESKKWFPIKAI